MSNKPNRKNRTDLVVNWPTNGKHFTVNDLFDLNPEFIRITLRVRLQKAITETKTVAVIGTLAGNKGRPKQVYVMTPVSREIIEEARLNEKITIVPDGELVKVLEITPTITDTPTPVNEVEESVAVVNN